MSSEDRAEELRARIERREAVIAVMGLGYIGLPLAGAAVAAGFPVLGFDIDASKVDKLERGENYLPHLGNLGAELAAAEAFEPTADPDRLAAADVVVLCVPTPLGPHREPDLSYVISSTETVAHRLKPGMLVVLTSTTYPGTTRDEVRPVLERGGLRCGQDFFLAYSPEREDPGSGVPTRSIPKLVGGIDETSRDLAVELLSQIVSHVEPVASVEIAEAAKLLENIYRAVNIALVNELKVLLERLDIDVWQVIAAAATKPFGFQPFFPGPGLGGHCIPIDPFYLTWKAKEVGMSTRFIELAGEINAEMPRYVVSRVAHALNEVGKPLRGARVLIVGIAYKPNVNDIRETPAAPILELLRGAGVETAYHDPHVPTFPAMRKYSIDLTSSELTPEILASQDCVLVLTDHAAVDWSLIAEHAPLVVDTRNAMRGAPGARVVRA